MQRYLDRLDKWTEDSHKVQQRVIQSPSSGEEQPPVLVQVGNCLEISFAEKVVVDKKLTMNLQYTLTANHSNSLLGCIRKSVASRSSEVLLPLYSALLFLGEATSGVLGLVLGSPVKGKHKNTEVSQVKTTKMVKGLDHLSYRNSLRDLGVFNVEKRRLRRDPFNVNKYLVGGSKDNRDRLFSMVPSDRTSVSGHKLKHKKFHLNIRKYFFTMRLLNTGTSCPGWLWGHHPWRYSKFA